MVKNLFISMLITGLTAWQVNASSLGQSAKKSSQSLKNLANGMALGVMHSFNGSLEVGKGISNLNLNQMSDGSSTVFGGSVEVVVASVVFLKDSALVTFDFVKQSAQMTIEVSKDVGARLERGASATVQFVLNTVGEAAVTPFDQTYFASVELSHMNPAGAVRRILLIPVAVWDALMTPDEPYKIRSGN